MVVTHKKKLAEGHTFGFLLYQSYKLPERLVTEQAAAGNSAWLPEQDRNTHRITT